MTPLDELYAELERVQSMSETQVMEAYNADSKAEIIELIREDIDNLERPAYPSFRHLPTEHDPDMYSDQELEQERTQICLSQGLSRYC